MMNCTKSRLNSVTEEISPQIPPLAGDFDLMKEVLAQPDWVITGELSTAEAWEKLREWVTEIVAAECFIIIRTPFKYAKATAKALEMLKLEGILGLVADHNSVLAVARNPDIAHTISQRISAFIE